MHKLFFFVLLIIGSSCNNEAQQASKLNITPGAYNLKAYLPLLEGKKVGLCVNQSSTLHRTHLTDTLSTLNIAVTKVFTPEHGFKGTVSDGVEIDYANSDHPFELISLYGSNKKPSPDQMKDIDVMVFDIQDVGTRFYTYISTMHYVMEACAENDVPLIVLDRPNPNGSYIDGPVLDTAFKSIVGMHPIPIVHGMTVGELAQMINGEGWLKNEMTCELKVIPVQHWNHALPYKLPIKPSPNLPNELSISLYPSLCLFEGTVMSVGRGTAHAFQQIGHPDYPDTSHHFVPQSMEGAKWPPHEGVKCFGLSWIDQEPAYQFSLSTLIATYAKMKEKPFFNAYFSKLAGTDQLRKQLEAGLSETEIKASWQQDLNFFIEKRAKYLIYE